MRFKYLSHREPNGLGVRDVLQSPVFEGAYDAYARCLLALEGICRVLIDVGKNARYG